MNNVVVNSKELYRPFSSDSLITQVIILNLVDALLTLYATGVGIGELNPFMDSLLSYGPVKFLAFKVGLVTSLLLAINKLVGRRGTQLYLFLSTVYWLVTGWHIFGLLTLYGAF